MATEADLIQKFKDLNIPVGADFEELIHEAFAGANLASQVSKNKTNALTAFTLAQSAQNQSNTNEKAITDLNKGLSTVVHSTVTELKSTDMNTVQTAGFYRLLSGTNGMPNADNHADMYTLYQVIPLSYSNGVQLAYGTNNAILGMRSWNSYHKFTGWVQFADDSKVAHLSGANNFDTIPTVNNNQLLLASSLPSDLARTSQQTNFTAGLQSNGNEVATQSDVTTAISTATANMADTTKATNFTAGLQSDGHSIIPIETSTDKQTAQANSTKTPNVIYLY